MFIVDLIVCFVVLLSESARRAKDDFRNPKTWLHLGVFALIGGCLIGIAQAGIKTYQNRLFLAHAGWWCEVNQVGRDSLTHRISCFEIRYSLLGAQVELSGTAWDNGEQISDWTMSDVLQANSNASRAVYSYSGHTYDNGSSVVDTSYGITEVNFASMTGWYLSKTQGRVKFNLKTLDRLRQEFGVEIADPLDAAQLISERYSQSRLTSHVAPLIG